jgi:hypothetical protein
MTRAAAVVSFLLASACIPGNGPMMMPFQDCLGCHGSSAKTWTAAGTWRQGSHVSITDATGKTVSLHGNEAGNFYTAERLAFPLTVSVDGNVMKDSGTGAPIPLGYGGCNACHRAELITVGPEMAPGSDCLSCHSVGGMASAHPFTAAGTFPPQGQTVVVGSQTATTNRVGNFYITAPVGTFPVPASVGGRSMEGGAPYGGCGRCHGNGGSGEGGGGD